MARKRSSLAGPRDRRLLVVEDDPGVGYAISRWLRDQQVRSVLATSTGEAMDMLRDIVFIESAFDGMLVDYTLPDESGCRIIEEFQTEFPMMPVALMTGYDDPSLELWLKERGIPLFRKPLRMEELQNWLESIKLAAVG